MTKTITVCSAVGGAGTSTLAVNLAVAMSLAVAEKRGGSRVALVDLDFAYGVDDMMLNLMPPKTILDWLRDIESQLAPRLTDYLTVHKGSGLSLLPSASKPDFAYRFRLESVKKLLTELSETFDFVVLDTTNFASDVTAVAMEMSTTILLITTPELQSLHHTRTALEVLRQANAEDRVQLVVNRWIRDAAIDPNDTHNILVMRHRAIFPLDEKSVVTSQNARKPFTLSNATLISYKVHDLASELLLN